MTRERVRVSGHPLPKFGFRLSEEGWAAADRLRHAMGSRIVTVRTPNVGALSVRLSEVPRLASSRIDLAGAVAAARKGQIDLTRAAPASRARRAAVWGAGLRRVDRLFGRSRELEALDRWWASEDPVVLVTGLAGIGKSALVATWVQQRRLGADVFGFEARPSSTSAGFLGDFASFLASLGSPGLAAMLGQGVPLDLAFVSRLLGRELTEKPLLVVIDNADQIPRELGRFVRGLLVDGPPRLPVRVVLLGRRVPKWFAARNPNARTRSTLALEGLDGDASADLLRAHGLSPGSPVAEDIVRRTRGHPLLLHLSASHGAAQGSVVRRYLQEEVWVSLSPADRAGLEAASVFRTPVAERVLEAVASTDHGTLESLAERSLLERTMAGGFVMHDLVRDFVSGQISESRRRQFHGRAAEVQLRSTDSRERWEGLYHLLAAGKVARAATFLDSEAASLLDSVAAEDIASLTRGLSLGETDAGTYCVFAELAGDSLRTRGHSGPALHQYDHARRLAEAAGRPDRIPRLLRKMAYLERIRNRYARALGHLVEAQGRLAGSANPAERLEVLRELSLAEQALGDLAAASRYLNEAVDLATELSDRPALSRTLLALGSLQVQLGHPEQGLDSGLEGLRVAERSGSLTELAHAHIVVGAILTGLGRSSESLVHYEQGFETARLLGNLRLMAYAAMNRANALLQLQRYAAARESLRSAADSFGVLEEKDAIGFLRTYEGELEMGLGHWSRATRAFEEGVAALRAHGSPVDLALVLREIASFYGTHGDEEASETYLLQARDIARRIKNRPLAAGIDGDLRRLSGTHPLSE